MTMPIESPVGTLLASVTACVCSALREAGRPVCDCCLTHSDTVLPSDGADCGCDTDGETGRLNARVLTTEPVDSPNLPASSKCAQTELEVILQVGVFRCITVPEGGEAPPCDITTAEALGFLADEQIMRAAVGCCDVKSLPGRWVLTPGQWAPRGPDGGIAGGVLSLRAYGFITFPPALTAANRNSKRSARR